MTLFLKENLHQEISNMQRIVIKLLNYSTPLFVIFQCQTTFMELQWNDNNGTSLKVVNL